MIAAAAPAAHISADRFVRIVGALLHGMVTAAVGHDWTFALVQDFDVRVWIPRAGHLTLELTRVDADGTSDGPALRTVTVCPGAFRPFDVISGGIVLDETHGARAALSTALDYVSAPALASTQHEPDTFAV